jgi:hypothetical protein
LNGCFAKPCAIAEGLVFVSIPLPQHILYNYLSTTYPLKLPWKIREKDGKKTCLVTNAGLLLFEIWKMTFPEYDPTGHNCLAGNQQNSLSNIFRFTQVEKNSILKLLKIWKQPQWKKTSIDDDLNGR